jgi:hypothetical protein
MGGRSFRDINSMILTMHYDTFWKSDGSGVNNVEI